MLQMIEDILLQTELKSDRINIQKEPCELTRLFEPLKLQYTKFCQNKGLRFHFSISEKTPKFALLDPNKTQILARKLLDNALKFTESGFIKLTIDWQERNDQHYLELSVEDSGIGIASDQLTEIFNPFLQTERSWQRRFGGLGIGLSISALLVEELNGELDCDSELGKGSRFFLSLPSQNMNHTLSEKTQDIAGLQEDLFVPNDMLVLVVDDNPVNIHILEKMLQRLGYKSVSANNGKEAIRILEKQPICLILMDLQMPVMDGFCCTQLIRSSQQAYQQLPIIGVTANLMDADKEHCLRAGMNDFLKKPVKMAALKASLSTQIKQTNDCENTP